MVVNIESRPESAFRLAEGTHEATEPAPSHLDPRHYHVFTYRGDHVLYDVATGTISVVDDLARDVLELARTRTRAEIEAELEPRWGARALADTFADLEVLCVRGYFAGPERLDEAEVARRIEALVEHRPRRVQLLSAQACNLECTYCYAEQQGSNALNRLMSWETAKAAIDQLIARSGSRRSLSVNFFGGEPLLNDALVRRVVAYCHEQGARHDKVFDFTISTNGTLLDDDKIEFLVEHGFHFLVSIDGDEETHERQRPSRNGGRSYHGIVESAKKLQARYRNPRAIKVRANASEAQPSRVALADALDEHGFSFIGVGSIEARPAGPDAASLTEAQRRVVEDDDEVLLGRFLDAVRSGRRLAYDPWSKSLRSLKTQRSLIGIRCGVCRNTTTVGTNGKLYPCHRYEGMDAFEIGSVEGGVDEERVRAYYRAAHENSVRGCSGCWARVICGGECTWELNDDEGGFHQPTVAHCDGIRGHLEKTMWLYARLRLEAPEQLDRIMGDA